MTIGFNGGTELGSSVPNFTDFESSVNASTTYGPVDIGSCTKSSTVDLNGQLVNCTGGGLIDLGRVVLVPNEDNPGTDCTDPGIANTTDCELQFVFEPDGQMDPGRYYVPGGSLDYDGLALQFGIRVTFGK